MKKWAKSPISLKKVIMAIGAHADDVEIRSGGTLAKYHKMGYEVVYVLTTNNTAGAHTSQTALEHATQRREEAREGAQILHTEPIYVSGRGWGFRWLI
jgi:LmbE family N-acetylglucosaminyl deacetylase